MNKSSQPLTRKGFLQLYQSLGFSVIPLGYGTKIPTISWSEYTTRRPTEQEIGRWFSASEPVPNVGTVCGRVSNNLVAIDFEEESAARSFFPDWAKLLRQTFVTRSAHGGIHIYFFEVGEVPRRTIRIVEEPAVDLLGEGLVTAPWSVIDHSKCENCGHSGTSAVYPLSLGLRPLEVEGIEQSILKRANELGWKIRQNRFNIKSAARGVAAGERNVTGFRYARYLCHIIGLDEETAWVELSKWNQRNSPPLLERELRTIFESAKKYPTTSRNGSVFKEGAQWA